MRSNNYTENEILEAIREGGPACEQVMAWLYKTKQGGIINFVRERNGSEAEAKDVFQDAIINLVMAVRERKFEGKSAITTYLYAIAKNLWYRRFKRGLRQEPITEGQIQTGTDFSDPEMFLVEEDQSGQLTGLMKQLKPKCQDVLLLWAEKYSMKEISAKVGYGNEQVVRNKKNACMKELKELVRNNPQVRNLIKELHHE